MILLFLHDEHRYYIINFGMNCSSIIKKECAFILADTFLIINGDERENVELKRSDEISTDLTKPHCAMI